MNKEMTKSVPISKQMVYDSYLNVNEKGGSAGIDKQSIEEFNADLSKNLYKIWNRMTSGSYFPPAVRTVFIPKKGGGERALGIPTVSDRIAQGVVKTYLEPSMEAIFYESSFGYRPNKSAHDALEQCHQNCRKYGWVIDLDIKGFFDNINHAIMIDLLGKHTQEKWVLMYVGRWLNAGVEQKDGSIISREQGTPQGGVISPVLANLYLHHAFDTWLSLEFPLNVFERYADDIVIHCESKEASETLLEKLKTRMGEFNLTLHPEKTKIVYCKNYQRTDRHDNESFTFLGFDFQPRAMRSKFGTNSFVVFAGAISKASKVVIREGIRAILPPRMSNGTLEGFAEKLNPKIRGWINYYTKFYKYETLNVFHYLNKLIRKWIGIKYKLQSQKSIYQKYRLEQAANPNLFYHWKVGIRE